MKALSASQIELYRRCQRRWAFRYRTDLPKAGFDAASSLGTEVHKIAETYQTTGKFNPTALTVDISREGPPSAADIFREGMRYMPYPKTGKAEHRFDMTLDDVPYMGFIDWYGDAAALDVSLLGSNYPGVTDYKTSSDPVKHGLKGESDFLTHVQPLTYARFALEERRQADHVYMRWLYFKTKGKPKAFPVNAILHRGQVLEAFDRIVHAPAKVIRHLRVINPNDLDANRGACHDFNKPCEYAAHCKPDTEEFTGMGMLEDLMSLAGDAGPEQAVNVTPAEVQINRPRRVSTRSPAAMVEIVTIPVEEVRKGTPAPAKSIKIETVKTAEAEVKTDGAVGVGYKPTRALAELCQQLNEEETYKTLKALAVKLLAEAP